LERSEIAIVIPAHNEASTIESVIKNVKEYGSIVLVNDGSTDSTLEIAKKYNIKIINNEKNLGYDKSINVGFNYSKNRFKYLITFDADGQHSPEDLKKVISKLDQKFDIVYGSRDKVNRISEKFFLFFSKILFNILDPLTGLKGINLNKFKDKSEFSKLNTLGSEIIFFSKKRKYKIIDISINISPRKDISRFGGLIKSNLLVLKAMLIVFMLYISNRL
tara:strand:+ start:409 stop:1065 length:657 start_codon:yes stop_codon:yes gene_type:complete